MTWWKNLFIIIYLIIQVTLPLRGFLYERIENRGNFSWNMYTYFYRFQVQYRLDTPQGETHWLAINDYFKRKGSPGTAFIGEFLPKFHRWLCDKFRSEGKLGSLRGYVHGSVNGGTTWDVVDRNVDLCTAPNYGIRAQREALKK